MVIGSINKLKVLERRRQQIKDEEWRDGHITHQKRKEVEKMLKDSEKTQKLNNFGGKK